MSKKCQKMAQLNRIQYVIKCDKEQCSEPTEASVATELFFIPRK